MLEGFCASFSKQLLHGSLITSGPYCFSSWGNTAGISPEKSVSRETPHHPVLLLCLCRRLEALISPRSRNVTVLNGTGKPLPQELIAGRVSRGRRTAVMLGRKETSLLIQIATCSWIGAPVESSQYPQVHPGIPAEQAALNLPVQGWVHVCSPRHRHVLSEGLSCLMLRGSELSQSCPYLRMRKCAPGCPATLRGWASLGPPKSYVKKGSICLAVTSYVKAGHCPKLRLRLSV